MAKEWSCPSCTFLNEEQVKNRCTMCRAQRPRTVSPKRNNPNVLVLDLTSNSKSKANGDIHVNVASTESARKRQRSKTDTNSDINNSSSRRQRNNRNRDGSSNQDGNRNRKRHNSECTDDSSNASTSRIRNMNIGGDLDKKSISIGSTRDSDINNTATISFVKERTTKSKSKQSKQSSSMVQQTLFGSIVKNIQETDVDVDVSKPQLHVRVVSNKARKYPSNRQTQHDDDDMIDVVDTRHEIDKLEQLDHHSSQPQPQPQKKTRPRTNSKQSYEKLFAKAMKTLHAKFSIPTLRNLQPLAIQSALQGKSQIIVMATGGGKSLCYQLPAAVLPGVTIVVSPLIALMVDQVNALCRKGIEAVMLSSAMGEKEKKIVWKRLVSTGTGKITSTSTGTGTGEKEKENDKNNPTNAKKQVQSTKKEKDIKLLYCTPELIQTTRFRAVLSNLYSRGLLALVAIDEAHCLSTWGHDFRPAYRKLSWIRHSFPDVPCMACTATATKKVIQDIKQVLCFTSGEECHMSTFNRPNVSYEVRYRDSMGDVEALKDLVKTVQTQHQKAQREGVPCSGIVYVHKRDDTTMISATLQKAGIAAAPYHAGLKDKDRTRIQQEWTDGIINVAIATVAFGMGIDLAHVRYVLHWSMSKTVEGFYQESGRAGRDGLASKSILYYSKGDATKFAFLIRKNSEKNEAKGKKSVGDDHSLDALNKMVEFCTISCCRRKYLLKHFGEDIDPQVVCKKTCDYCLDPEKVERALNTSSVAKAVRDIKQQRFRFKEKAAVLDGGFNHGIESDYDDDGDYAGSAYYPSTSDSGLGITCTPSDGFTTGGGKKLKGFSSAKNVLSKYEALECRASSSGRNKGFVNFRAKSKLQNMNSGKESREHVAVKSTSVSIPSHMMQLIQTKASKSVPSAIASQKSSKEISMDADRVRAELEEIRKKREKLLAKFRKG